MFFVLAILGSIVFFGCKNNSSNLEASQPKSQVNSTKSNKPSESQKLVDVLMKYGQNPTFPALNQAMVAKDYDAVKTLIEHDVDINSRGSDIKTDINSKPHVLSNAGQTVLEIALENGDKKLIKYFLKKGADPYSERRIGHIIHDRQATAGMWERSTGKAVQVLRQTTTAIYDIVKAGRTDLLSIIVDSGVDINETVFVDLGKSFTAVQLALMFGKKEVVAYLLEHGAKI